MDNEQLSLKRLNEEFSIVRSKSHKSYYCHDCDWLQGGYGENCLKCGNLLKEGGKNE